jgi:hypothetical protein
VDAGHFALWPEGQRVLADAEPGKQMPFPLSPNKIVFIKNARMVYSKAKEKDIYGRSTCIVSL